MATFTREAEERKVQVTSVTLTLSRQEALALWNLICVVRESPNRTWPDRTVKSILTDVSLTLGAAFSGDVERSELTPVEVIGGNPVARTESLTFLEGNRNKM